MPPARRSQNPTLKTPLKKTPARPKPATKKPATEPATKSATKPVITLRLPKRVRLIKSEEREAQEEATGLEGREDFSPSLTAQMQRERRAHNAVVKEALDVNLNESCAIDAEASRL